jgi:hypothetical protein
MLSNFRVHSFTMWLPLSPLANAFACLRVCMDIYLGSMDTLKNAPYLYGYPLAETSCEVENSSNLL